jgi:hypothetical protein
MDLMQPESSADSDDASAHSYATAADYQWKLQDSLRYWYSAAETKAQVVLTLNGVFLAFITGSILGNREAVARTVAIFGAETWIFIAGMSIGSAGSITCAVCSLMARRVRVKRTREVIDRYSVDPDRADTYVPEITVFFTDLAELRPDLYAERMLLINPQFVVRALASMHVEWSKAIRRKHQLVNGAFILTGVALGFFICVSVSYLVRVSLAA